MFKSAVEAVLNFIFPAHCPACGAQMETRGAWCHTCLTQTVAVSRLSSAESSSCLTAVWSLGHYSGTLRDMILSLKYHRKLSVLPYIVTFLAATENYLPPQISSAQLVVPVPLHTSREKERGFNQVELIFRPWLTAKGLTWENALRRTKATCPQFELTASERRQNLRGVFACVEPMAISGQNILLVDDITTTGTTLGECAQALKFAGAKNVSALVLASDRC